MFCQSEAVNYTKFGVAPPFCFATPLSIFVQCRLGVTATIWYHTLDDTHYYSVESSSDRQDQQSLTQPGAFAVFHNPQPRWAGRSRHSRIESCSKATEDLTFGRFNLSGQSMSSRASYI